MVGSQSMGNFTLWPKTVLSVLLIISVEEFPPGSLPGWLILHSEISMKDKLLQSTDVSYWTSPNTELSAVLKSMSPVSPTAWKYKLEIHKAIDVLDELCPTHV